MSLASNGMILTKISICLRKKIDIKAWADTNRNKNTKIGFKNYQIIDKMYKKCLFFYLPIYQDQKMNPSNKKKKKSF